jgi:transposase-like protein
MAAGKTNQTVQEYEGLLTNPSTSDRTTRGLEISKANRIEENADGSFSVPSQVDAGVSYEVKALGAEWVCSCPDFENRADTIEACKHIHAVRFWIAAQVELREKPKPKVFADDAVQCAKCGSIRVIKYGRSAGKQVFKCQDCQSKFREGLMKGAKYSPEMVSLTLDLYFSGMSLRKIARTVNDHYGLNLGGASVYRWIQRYVPMVSAYVNSLAPQLSATWHADEVFVKMKGGENLKEKGAIAYLWNVMDRKTRFLLASKLSKFRDVAGADRAFVEAFLNAGSKMPEKVFTDAHHAYRAAIKKWPQNKRPQHIPKAGINKPHANNNRIERLNGTVRERVKVQRGWKSMQSQIAEGLRIHYNFVKPHEALNGQTPAQAAGIGIQGENIWLELLTKALTTRGETP